MIPPLPHVQDLKSYALVDLSPPAGKRAIALALNESLRAPSPLAVKAAAAATRAGNLYPDTDWCALRDALGALHGVSGAQILCGNGSMELIDAVVRAYADPHNGVLAPRHAYPYFRTATATAQARFDTAQETDLHVSVDALLAAVQPDTRLVFLANPANPTGTRISLADLTRLRENLRGDILLVIDEAYGEFSDPLNEPSFDLVTQGNTVVLRSFSKAYGLAGMRVGWGLFPPDIAGEVRKVINPGTVSRAGQAAALAALNDQIYMLETRAMTEILRHNFSDRLRHAGFAIADSFTNFVMIPFENARAAHSADMALRREGVILRPQAGAGLPRYLRATIGAADDLDFAADLLARWRQQA